MSNAHAISESLNIRAFFTVNVARLAGITCFANTRYSLHKERKSSSTCVAFLDFNKKLSTTCKVDLRAREICNLPTIQNVKWLTSLRATQLYIIGFSRRFNEITIDRFFHLTSKNSASLPEKRNAPTKFNYESLRENFETNFSHAARIHKSAHIISLYPIRSRWDRAAREIHRAAVIFCSAHFHLSLKFTQRDKLLTCFVLLFNSHNWLAQFGKRLRVVSKLLNHVENKISFYRSFDVLNKLYKLIRLFN